MAAVQLGCQGCARPQPFVAPLQARWPGWVWLCNEDVVRTNVDRFHARTFSLPGYLYYIFSCILRVSTLLSEALL
jgi:hypothetical protein